MGHIAKRTCDSNNSEQTMKSAANNWNLFGFDLRELLQRYVFAWRELLWVQGSWGRKALDYPVRLLEPKGDSAADLQSSEFSAWVLDEEHVLFRVLDLPKDVAVRSLDQIVNAEVVAASPFSFEDTVYGWKLVNRSSSHYQVVLAISSRVIVKTSLVSAEGVPNVELAQVEIWANWNDEHIVIDGFGELARYSRYKRRLVGLLSMLLLSSVLLLVAAAVPVAQKGSELRYMQELYDGAQREARSAVQMRSQLARTSQYMETLSTLSKEAAEPLSPLAMLTREIPVNGWLLSFQQDGNRVRIEGIAENAAVLMQDLGAVGLFEKVQQVSAIRKTGNNLKERYQFELFLPAVAEGEPSVK